MRRRLLALAAASVLCAAAPAAWAAPAAPPAKSAPAPAADARLRDLYEKEWAWRRAQFAGELEEDDDAVIGADHLPKVDPASQAARLARWQETRRRLDAIPETQLSPAEQINYEVYKAQIDALIAEQTFREYEKPFNSDSSFWSGLGFEARQTFRTREDYRRYLGQLNDIPRYFEEQTANMRAGLARGFTPPKVTLTGRDVSIASEAEAKDVESSQFWAPFKTMPASIPAAEQEALKAQARQVIAAKVKPAYVKLLTFVRQDYIPHAAENLAAESLPDGKAYYRSKIREFTTLDMDPEQIHQLGLSEVAKIHAQMQEVMTETGFKGDFPAFLQFLRTDPRFYAKTPEELLSRAAWIAKRVDGKIGNYIGWLPRSRFTIEPVPADIAPFYTSGRGGSSVYLVNTYDLPARPLYNLTALTLHESSPGHSLQGELSQEQDRLPAFRRNSYISAYGEGWALYCEKLGVEMGMYETPYDRFGMLTFQMWRAARLVVDTGIHHKGWTREQAVKFLHDNTALSDRDISNEVDRYISWPGQALSYYLGELDMLKNRQKAEAALGSKFDIRAFHDLVLSLGSVPLPVLDRQVDRFIADGGRDPMPVKWQKAVKAGG